MNLTLSSLLVNLNPSIHPGHLKTKQKSKMVCLGILRYLIIQIEIIHLLIVQSFISFCVETCLSTCDHLV